MNQSASGTLSQPIAAYAYATQDEEINLIDVWVALTNYRKVFFSVFLLVLCLGLFFVFYTYKEKYSLVSMVQIGTFEQENTIMPLESPESLLSKINSSIIPRYSHQWMDAKQLKNIFKTETSNPKGSEIIVFSNKVKENDIELYSSYQSGLAEIIIEDHQRLINSFQAKLISSMENAQLKLKELQNPLTLDIKLKASQIRLDAEKNKLKKLQDESFFGIKKTEFKNNIVAGENELELLKKAENKLQQQVKRVDENRTILSRSIAELSQQIDEDRKNKKAAQQGVTELSAMSQLLIANEIQQNHNRLLALEERYYVTLENEKSDLSLKIVANQFKQADAEKKIKVLRQKYDQLLQENQLEIEQQKLVIDKIELDARQIRFNHQNNVATQMQAIKEIKTRLDNYNETRMVSPPVPSLTTTGLTRNTLIILVIFLATFIGFGAMLIAMFADKVKQRRVELAQSDA